MYNISSNFIKVYDEEKNNRMCDYACSGRSASGIRPCN